VGSSKKVTVGFRYKMGLHFALCRGPVDRVEEIICGERLAAAPFATDSVRIYIDKADLFGGDKREGGVLGYADIEFGHPDQAQNSYLASKISSLVSAYRGVVSVIFNGGRVTSNNPYIKPWWFRVQRIHTTGDGTVAQWYDAKAEVSLSGDAFESVIFAAGDEFESVTLTGLAVPTAPYNLSDYLPSSGSFGAAAPQPFGHIPSGEPDFDEPVVSYWQPARRIWLRRTFTLSSTGPISIRMYAENSAFFWWDGTFIDAYNYDNSQVTGLDGYVDLTIPATLATAGTHTVYLLGLDENSSLSSPASSYTYLYLTGTQSQGGIAAMNPAHILRECLTDPYMRMNYPSTMIDDTSFSAAADTFHAEGLGLCLFWSRQTPVKEFMQTVLDHCGAVYYADPVSGKFVLTPIRGDYTPAALDVYDESSIVGVDSFERGGSGEVVNEISVSYMDVVSGKEAVVTIQDLASVYSQGSIISQTKPYPGLPTAAIAARVAQRDLVASTASLARLKVRFTRKASGLRPGGVIKLSWAKLGLSELICRVLDVNYGGLAKGEIRAELAEDVFGLPASSYQTGQDTSGGWTSPDTIPQPVATAHVLEGTYWDVFKESPTADFESLQDDSGFVYTLAEPANGSQYSYSIHSRIDPADYELVQDGLAFAPKTTLAAAVSRDDLSITVSDTSGEFATTVAVGDRLLLPGEEQMEVTDITNIGTGVLVVNRGVLDTTPQEFASGVDVWLLEYDEEDFGRDGVERFAGDVVDYKLTSASADGDSSLEVADELPLTFDSRMLRPYPPGKILIDGQAFPASPSVVGGFTVTWAHRDRQQQTASFISQDEPSIGPEAGTTYNLYFYDDGTDTQKHAITGLTGTTYTLPTIPGSFTGRLEIESQRGGFLSWQRQVRTFPYDGGSDPLSGSYLVSGGLVTFDAGTTYDVTAADYVISGTAYATLADTVTLSAAHPNLPRIDAVIIDTSEVVSVLEGDPAVTPVACMITPLPG